MEKRKERRSSYKARFVQPLIPDFLNSFSIPKAFMRRHLESELKGAPLQKVLLMAEPQRQWVVEIERGGVFKGGWVDFCEHHKLGVGDILVFVLNKTELLFHVFVYDPATSCQRHYLPSSPNQPQARGSTKRMVQLTSCFERKLGKDVHQQLPLSQFPSFKIILPDYFLKRNILYLPLKFARSNGLHNRKCDITIVDEKERHWEMMLSSKKSTGHPYIVKGLKHLWLANSFKSGDILIFHLLKGGEKLMFKCYSSTKRRKLQLTSCSERKLAKDVHQQLPLSQFPSFQITLSDYIFNRNILYLPLKFARSNGLYNRKCDITIVDGEERHWEMKLRSNKSNGQLYIVEGLKHLLNANSFEIGDILIFHLLKGGEKPIFKCYSSTKRRKLGKAVHQQLPVSQLPSFQIALPDYFFNKYILHLPLKFARSNGLYNRNCDITIVDEEERHWEMMLRSSSGRPYIGKGLKHLWLANSFKIGDILMFHLLKGGQKPIFICYNMGGQVNLPSTVDGDFTKVSSLQFHNSKLLYKAHLLLLHTNNNVVRQEGGFKLKIKASRGVRHKGQPPRAQEKLNFLLTKRGPSATL